MKEQITEALIKIQRQSILEGSIITLESLLKTIESEQKENGSINIKDIIDLMKTIKNIKEKQLKKLN